MTHIRALHGGVSHSFDPGGHLAAFSRNRTVTVMRMEKLDVSDGWADFEKGGGRVGGFKVEALTGSA